MSKMCVLEHSSFGSGVAVGDGVVASSPNTCVHVLVSYEDDVIEMDDGNDTDLPWPTQMSTQMPTKRHEAHRHKMQASSSMWTGTVSARSVSCVR